MIPPPISPAIVAVLARSVGLPEPLPTILDQIEGPLLNELLARVRRYQDGEPLDHITRAVPPDPDAVFRKVDAEER